ncbi:hypothetical protein GCM10011507_07270 [Edaphobacter acidisoli]|uniref:Uncharacterized protein n=1 Tax=Edaphobacter acidisoli TaxID=2040573 RepID=A0A916RIG1_9BACT|nr:hypothetical protein GCM10011507_07270 [Edaphobacter acidisoli]
MCSENLNHESSHGSSPVDTIRTFSYTSGQTKNASLPEFADQIATHLQFGNGIFWSGSPVYFDRQLRSQTFV